MGYDSDLPKLSPMDEALYDLNSHRLVRPGMNLNQVGELVVYEEDLLDASSGELDALDMVWRAASQLVDSGAVRFHLRGGWIDDCNLPFGTAREPAILDIGDFRGFLLGRYQSCPLSGLRRRLLDELVTRGFGVAILGRKGGSVERVSYEAVSDALVWRIWPGKLQRALYTLISDWDQEDVDVSRQDETITLQVSLDDSYESLWESERLQALDLTLTLDAEAYELEGYKWKYRANPGSRYCDTYEEVAQMIDLGIDFTVPPEVAAADSRADSYRARMYEFNPPMVPDIKRPKAP